MENGVEHGVDEAGENQVVSSSDGEGDCDGEGEVEGEVLQPPQITNDCEGVAAGEGERAPATTEAIDATPDSGPTPLDGAAPGAMLEDNLCDKDVDSDAGDEDNDDEVSKVPYVQFAYSIFS